MIAAVETVTVGEIMQRQVVSVDLDETLAGVRDLFTRYGFHHLVIMDADRLVGVVSDRDLLKHLSPFVGRQWSEKRRDAETLKVRVHKIMSRKLETVSPETPASEAAQLMLRRQVSCLPVVEENGQLQGIVTLRDLVQRAYCTP